MNDRQRKLFDSQEQAGDPWESAAERDRWTAQVVFNHPLTTVFDYRVPDDLRDLVNAGQRVRVPFGRGNRLLVGFCVGVGLGSDSQRSLKTLDSLVDSHPLLGKRMLELTRWIAQRQLCGWGQVLEIVIPAGVKKQSGTRLVTVYEVAAIAVANSTEVRLPKKQQAVFDILSAATAPMRSHELTQAAACGMGPVQGLQSKGLITSRRQRVEAFTNAFAAVDREPDLKLNGDQQRALDSVIDVLRSRVHRTFLLRGVTGSGKTEVYIQAIREVVGYGRQAIVLVPEISLTPQTIRRFRCRFDSVAVLHSHLGDAERHWHWQRIARGEVQVVVGARSAVFAPTPQLGLIVIDEEHETTFKQDTTPRYHARDVARKRAELESVPLLLGSATPTLESWVRAQQNPDELLTLPRRVAERPLPPVVVVDVRHDPHISKGAALGRVLHLATRTALEDGGQVLLFLNLRGFSTTLWCHSCGTAAQCPSCDVTLTWHKDRNLALCHFCDYETLPPSGCPSCGSASMRYFGIGTQKLEQEVATRFPGYKCLRMDSDTMRKPGSHDEALEAFRQGEVQILLGTQMIAKGLDFPNVTLVGVINADTMLHQPDLRASERTFQLLAQVAGRTGRSVRGGRVYVQSTSPAEPAIVKAAEHDYLSFVRAELQNRMEMGAPPYAHWTRVILRGADEKTVRRDASRFADVFRAHQKLTGLAIRILGPAPAPVAKLKQHYRHHLQLSAQDLDIIHQLWEAVRPELTTSRGVDFVVDVDPVNMR
ncbi:MAG: primosomal protein N' [Planctomycetaceae bacterium]